MKHEADCGTTDNWQSLDGPKRLKRKCGGEGNQRTNREYPVFGIVKIIQNIEKSPGDLR